MNVARTTFSYFITFFVLFVKQNIVMTLFLHVEPFGTHWNTSPGALLVAFLKTTVASSILTL